MKMAPLKCLRIISFTSQDPCHKVENVINPQNMKKWLCSKDSVGGNLEVEIQLESSSSIEHINIGNHGSNFVEILVGRSMWSKERKYEVLLPSVSLMTPVECKEWKNISKVFMFSSANFHGHIAVQKWDRIRIKCRQPLVKEKQFGLGFIELRTPDAKKKASESNNKKGIRGSDAFKNMVNKALHSSGGSESSSGKPLSRSARCLQTALSKQKKPEIKSPGILRNTSKESNDLEFSSDDEYEYKGRKKENGPLRSSLQNRRYNEFGSFNKALKRENELQAYGNVNNRSFGKSKSLLSRKPKDFVSVKFESEVQDFVKEFYIDKTHLESVQVSDIRKMMEEMRGSRLNNAEKKIFFTVVGKALTKAISPKAEVSTSLAIKSDSEPNMPKKERSQASRENLTSDETPVCKDSKSTGKRRNLLTCRNVLCYDDDIEGPPRKKLNAPLEFSKKGEKDDEDGADADEGRSACPICGDLFSKITLEIHAAFCQGISSILEDDSQPTDENTDIENNIGAGPPNRKAESETQPGPSNVTSLSVTEHVQVSTPVNSNASQNVQKKTKANISSEPMNSTVFSTTNSNQQKRPSASATAATGHLQNQPAALHNSARRNSVQKKGNNPTSFSAINSSHRKSPSVATNTAAENFHEEIEAALSLSVKPSHPAKKKNNTKKSSKAMNGSGLSSAKSNKKKTPAKTVASRQNGTPFTALKDPKARLNTPKANSKTPFKQANSPGLLMTNPSQQIHPSAAIATVAGGNTNKQATSQNVRQNMQNKTKTAISSTHVNRTGCITTNSYHQKRPTPVVIKPKSTSSTSGSFCATSGEQWSNPYATQVNTYARIVKQQIEAELGTQGNTYARIMNEQIDTRLGMNVCDDVIALSSSTPPVPPRNDHGIDPDLLITKVQPSTDTRVACPICMEKFPSSYISYHANLCAEFS